MRTPRAGIGILAPVLLLWPPIASAQVIANLGPACNFVTGRITAACIPLFIAHLITLIFSLVGVFFIINIMIAGYQIAISGVPNVGDKEKGKNRLIWSIIGFIVTACSFLILDMLLSVVVERI